MIELHDKMIMEMQILAKENSSLKKTNGVHKEEKRWEMKMSKENRKRFGTGRILSSLFMRGGEQLLILPVINCLNSSF